MHGLCKLTYLLLNLYCMQSFYDVWHRLSTPSLQGSLSSQSPSRRPHSSIALSTPSLGFLAQFSELIRRSKLNLWEFVSTFSYRPLLYWTLIIVLAAYVQNTQGFGIWLYLRGQLIDCHSYQGNPASDIRSSEGGSKFNFPIVISIKYAPLCRQCPIYF
jgi:hypothetical protein